MSHLSCNLGVYSTEENYFVSSLLLSRLWFTITCTNTFLVLFNMDALLACFAYHGSHDVTTVTFIFPLADDNTTNQMQMSFCLATTALPGFSHQIRRPLPSNQAAELTSSFPRKYLCCGLSFFHLVRHLSSTSTSHSSGFWCLDGHRT